MEKFLIQGIKMRSTQLIARKYCENVDLFFPEGLTDYLLEWPPYKIYFLYRMIKDMTVSCFPL